MGTIDLLTKEATNKKNFQTANQISLMKDDMRAIFYQKCWHIIRKSDCHMMRPSLINGQY